MTRKLILREANRVLLIQRYEIKMVHERNEN
jgi:hypothetical protein